MLNYKWFGQNRKQIHKNAKQRSGGIDFVVDDGMISAYNLIDNDYEGKL